MPAIDTFFEDFLAKISPTDEQLDQMDLVHDKAVKFLSGQKLLSHIWVKSFVQGSYRRETGLIGTEEHPCDIDVVVVTKLPHVLLPAFALELFSGPLEKFCDEIAKENPKGRFCAKPQGRSWGIAVSPTISLDIVPTSSVDQAWNEPLIDAEHSTIKLAEAEAKAGEEMLGRMANFSFRGKRDQRRRMLVEATAMATADEGIALKAIAAFRERQAHVQKTAAAGQREVEVPGALRIPDHNIQKWVATHPLAQIEWTENMEKKCFGNFTKVVRCIKWWQRTRSAQCGKPKGYPLERLVGECCPVGITSVGQGVAETFKNIVVKFSAQIEQQGIVPKLEDYGTNADVWKRLTIGELRSFMACARTAYQISQKAISAADHEEAAVHWRELFGDQFPGPKPKATVPAAPPGTPTKFTGSDVANPPARPKTFA